MTKSEREKLKELARMYYMQGDTQQLAAEKVGVSRITINKWVSSGEWDKLRIASKITRKEIVTNLMKKASVKLEEDGLSVDEMSKIAAAIDRIDKTANPVIIIEVLSDFNEWLFSRMNIDNELTSDIVKKMNYYQNEYMKDIVTNKARTNVK